MVDVDGTLVPYDYEALPSDAVAKAVRKAQKMVTVCLVTGRSYSSLEGIFKKLEIHRGYAVLDGGAHVINLETKELLYDQPMNPRDVQKVAEVLEREGITFYAKQEVYELAYLQPIKKGQGIKNAYMFFTDDEYPIEKIERIEKELSARSNISVHKTRHKNPKGYGFNIQHVNATKAHGVEILMKALKIGRGEIIAVGDGYNDFSLLMASGLKIAMGNAVEDLKAIADYIASSVEEDGLAEAIGRFILENS